MNHDTTRSTIKPKNLNSAGFTWMERSQGEPYVGALPPKSARPIATILHSSDWHICDAESPGRQEFMDRFFDSDSQFQAVLGYIGTYRPWEILTCQVAAVFIDTMNRIECGPITGRPVDALVITGDVTDNGQLNELEWYLDLLDGRKVDPSGGRAQSDWVGATTGDAIDDRYWHPEEQTQDRPSREFGYPHLPGLIDAARRPFDSVGLRHPWLSVHGNHDALLQGVVAPDKELDALTIGDQRIVGLAPGQSPLESAQGVPAIGPANYIHRDDSPRAPVTPDPARRLTEPGKFAELHLTSTSLPAGHGFTAENIAKKTAYFSYEVGELVVLAMDSVNHFGGFEGAIDETQMQWIIETLNKYSDRLVVVASHHPSRTIINDYKPEGESRRILGDEILEEFMKHPNVVVWLNGHEHEHNIYLNVGPNGRILPEINTASIIDWPQQSRILEFLEDDETKSVYIISTVIDHDGLVEPDVERLDLVDMAGLSRILAFNDYQRRDPLLSMHRKEGNLADRNFVLRLPHLLK
ncbi:MAG: TIGR03767 family metallophosphoesterase [Actinomycetes bacterium]